MQQPLVYLGCAILLLSPILSSATGAGHAAADLGQSPGGDQTGPTTVRADAESQLQPLEPDNVALSVTVYENGTAQWRIEYRTHLGDQATRDAFQRFQRDRPEGGTAADREFFDRINASIAAAENATGREMTGTDFSVAATVRRLPQPYGVVVYRFRWEGFASVGDQRLRVGDALSGYFLGQEERLLLSWPRGYELSEVRPEPDTRRDRTVAWRGPQEFAPDEPRLVLTDGGVLWRDLLGVGTVGAVLGVVALLGVVVWLRRNGVSIPAATTTPITDSGDGSELLSNEEQVIELLRRRGGRVRQQVIADELDWTETKTSYVVSKLREEGRIDSFRLGRENVLSLVESDHDEQRA